MKKVTVHTGPEEIHGVSQSQFSIARYYGAIKFNGEMYIYDADRDALVRDDIWRSRAKEEKQARHAERMAEAKANQGRTK